MRVWAHDILRLHLSFTVSPFKKSTHFWMISTYLFRVFNGCLWEFFRCVVDRKFWLNLKKNFSHTTIIKHIPGQVRDECYSCRTFVFSQIIFLEDEDGGSTVRSTVSNKFNYLINFFYISSDEDCGDSPDIEDESWLACLVASSPSPVPDSNTWKKNLFYTLQEEHSFLAGRNLFKVQSEFSIINTIKKFLIDNHYKIIYGSVRSECSSCRCCTVIIRNAVLCFCKPNRIYPGGTDPRWNWEIFDSRGGSESVTKYFLIMPWGL